MEIQRSSFEMLAVAEIKPDPLNTRRHSDIHITQLAGSIKAFRFISPVLVNDSDRPPSSGPIGILV